MANRLTHFIKITLLAVVLWGATLHAQGARYPSLSQNRVVLVGDSGRWDADKVHTLSVVEANRGGYRYWGYYGLSYYWLFGGGQLNLLKAGLARSNDLIHWDKYEGNPIIGDNCRWPNAILVGSKFYVFYEEYDEANDSRIVMVTSKDGIHFDNKMVVVPRERGMQNQNPFIYFNKRDKNFYLFYYSGIEKSRDSTSKNWNIMVRKSGKIEDLKDANPMILITARHTLAAPSVAFYKNRYYLLVEAWNPERWGKKWVTLAYVSDKIDGKYKELSNSPVLNDTDACAFQYVFHNNLYIFYSHCVDTARSNWDLRMVKVTK